MVHTPRVSVVMPLYNGAEFVLEQLKSIRDQTMQDFELLVYDDCSTDDGPVIVRRFLGTTRFESRIWAGIARLGVSRSVEILARAARGKLLVLCDQDDLWAPEKLEFFVEIFERSPHTNAIYSDAPWIDHQGTLIGTSEFVARGLTDPAFRQEIHRGLHADRLLNSGFFTGMTIAARRKFVVECLPFPVNPLCLHDRCISMVAAATGTLDGTERQLQWYRRHDAQWSRELQHEPHKSFDSIRGALKRPGYQWKTDVALLAPYHLAWYLTEWSRLRATPLMGEWCDVPEQYLASLYGRLSRESLTSSAFASSLATLFRGSGGFGLHPRRSAVRDIAASVGVGRCKAEPRWIDELRQHCSASVL